MKTAWRLGGRTICRRADHSFCPIAFVVVFLPAAAAAAAAATSAQSHDSNRRGVRPRATGVDAYSYSPATCADRRHAASIDLRRSAMQADAA